MLLCPVHGAAKHECCLVAGDVREGATGAVLLLLCTVESVTNTTGPEKARSARDIIVAEYGSVGGGVVMGGPVMVMVTLVLTIVFG